MKELRIRGLILCLDWPKDDLPTEAELIKIIGDCNGHLLLTEGGPALCHVAMEDLDTEVGTVVYPDDSFNVEDLDL